MVREPEPAQEQKPEVVERTINLELINAKLNETLNILYLVADRQGIQLN